MSYNPNVPDFNNIAYDDLQKMKENFQILANIATSREDILSLAVEAGDILDSRIVEHNLNILSPSNGYYVRWENGLQICFRTATIDLSYNAMQYFPLPADFISYLDIVGGHSIGNFFFGTDDFNLRLAVSGLVVRIKDEAGWGVLIIDGSQTIESFPINLFAIGRWK